MLFGVEEEKDDAQEIVGRVYVHSYKHLEICLEAQQRDISFGAKIRIHKHKGSWKSGIYICLKDPFLKETSMDLNATEYGRNKGQGYDSDLPREYARCLQVSDDETLRRSYGAYTACGYAFCGSELENIHTHCALERQTYKHPQRRALVGTIGVGIEWFERMRRRRRTNPWP